MITEIDFKVTGEERKKLAYAIGERTQGDKTMSQKMFKAI